MHTQTSICLSGHRMIPVLITNPRSGTHYLKALLAAALGTPPVERSYATAQELRAALSAVSDRQVVYGHFRYSEFSWVLDPERLPDLRLFVLTRHPFDRLISQLAITRARGGRLPDRTRTPQQLAREILLGEWDGLPWADGYVVPDYPALHNFYQRELVTNWLVHRPCHLVKFEDLVADSKRTLGECLGFLGVRISQAELGAITARVTFSSLSGGRRPGETDPMSHYRSGTPGEWRGAFSRQDIERLRPRYASAFHELGYEL